MKVETLVYVHHHQFSIMDAGYDGPWGDWENENWHKNRYGVNPGLITLFTSRAAGIVPVHTQVLSSTPDVEEAIWDHIVQTHIKVGDDGLLLEGEDNRLIPKLGTECPIKIAVAKGVYGVLLCQGGVDTCRYDGADGADFYRISLWPVDTAVDDKVLKAAETLDQIQKRKPSPYALTELKDMLQGNTPAQRYYAATQLCRDNELDLIAELLESASLEMSVRRIIVSAIALFQDPPIELLFDNLMHKDLNLRHRILEAFCVILDDHPEGFDWDSIVERLNQFRDEDLSAGIDDLVEAIAYR